MHQKTEVISPIESDESQLRCLDCFRLTCHARDLSEITLVFVLLLAAVWTPPGKLNLTCIVITAVCVVAFAIAGRWNARAMGLTRATAGVTNILLAGFTLCILISALAIATRFAGSGNPLPWSRSWQYVPWALAQEFILQSFFFVRLESVLGARRAVWTGATLFALVHLPSPLLAVFSLGGGVLFCECFRRWRNLYPLGLIHAALGLTIAASLPDKWLHHMRVGIGYLTLHS
jgi:hypothetical protein